MIKVTGKELRSPKARRGKRGEKPPLPACEPAERDVPGEGPWFRAPCCACVRRELGLPRPRHLGYVSLRARGGSCSGLRAWLQQFQSRPRSRVSTAGTGGCEAAVTLWEWSCTHSLAGPAADRSPFLQYTLFLVFGGVDVLTGKVLLVADFLAAFSFFPLFFVNFCSLSQCGRLFGFFLIFKIFLQISPLATIKLFICAVFSF